jgi:periplasmic protein TonB
LNDLLDGPRFRLSIALLIAVAAWMFLLTHVMSRLSQPSPQTPAQEQPSMEMRLVEITPPAVPEPAPAHNEPSAKPLHARPSPAPVHAREPRVTRLPAIEHAIDRTETPSHPDEPAQYPPAPESEKPVATASSTARVINQPMPSLPDDLREDAFQAVAIARFDVHADGSVEVELSKPTSNPRLNALLLDALRKWRFFPAMQDGHAVESHQDVRVHFNIS